MICGAFLMLLKNFWKAILKNGQMGSGEFIDLKRGYGGRIVRSISGFDFVYNPFLYKILRWRMQRNRGVDSRMNSVGWNSTIENLPGASFLQTSEWAEIKFPNGWRSRNRTWKAHDEIVFAAASILYTGQLSKLPIRVAYIPRGPLVDWNNANQYQQVLSELISFAKSKKAIYLKIDPDLTIGKGIPDSDSDQPDHYRIIC